MALFLDEGCIASLLTMDDALSAVEEVFREQGRGGVVNVPRLSSPRTTPSRRDTKRPISSNR